MKTVSKRILLAAAVTLTSQIAFADDCVKLSGCYVNQKESQGAFMSLIQVSNSCWGTQYALGKVLNTGKRILALPDRSAPDYRVSDQEQGNTYRIAVDANASVLSRVIYSPPSPEYTKIVRSTVVEAGGVACGKSVNVRTLVEESSVESHPSASSCVSYPSVSPKLCESLIAFPSTRSIARCEGRGKEEVDGKSRPFTFKADLVEKEVGSISARVYREFSNGEYSIPVYEQLSFDAAVDPKKGLILTFNTFLNSEWFSRFPMVLNLNTLKTNVTKVDSNAGRGPGDIFDTIQCQFLEEGFRPVSGF
ncbi:MAG: hypothetical protein V4692_04385 [Bdellovibrionota bacterium]